MVRRFGALVEDGSCRRNRRFVGQSFFAPFELLRGSALAFAFSVVSGGRLGIQICRDFLPRAGSRRNQPRDFLGRHGSFLTPSTVNPDRYIFAHFSVTSVRCRRPGFLMHPFLSLLPRTGSTVTCQMDLFEAGWFACVDTCSKRVSREEIRVECLSCFVVAAFHVCVFRHSAKSPATLHDRRHNPRRQGVIQAHFVIQEVPLTDKES